MRLAALLVVALLGSCLLLVRTGYAARRGFAARDPARAAPRRLAADDRRLDAERPAQATHLRVEKVARDRLAMRPAAPGVTAYVVDDAHAAPAAVVSAAAGTRGSAR
ncbi:MAG: cell division protein FtsL [Rubrivivax sp.]